MDLHTSPKLRPIRNQTYNPKNDSVLLNRIHLETSVDEHHQWLGTTVLTNEGRSLYLTRQTNVEGHYTPVATLQALLFTSELRLNKRSYDIAGRARREKAPPGPSKGG